MTYHRGPTYQHINPQGLIGLLLVVFVAFGTMSLFSTESLRVIALCVAGFSLLALACSIWVAPRWRAKQERESVLGQEERLFSDTESRSGDAASKDA